MLFLSAFTLDEQLAREYGAEGLTACPMLKEGQVFYADYAKPEGFCDEAWKAIYQYAFALSHGAGKEVFYYGDWIRKPGVAIIEYFFSRSEEHTSELQSR